MKKLLCIALIVLLASPIFSQWLGFEFQFETGMANGKFGEIETDQDREYLSLYNFEVTYIELSPYFWFFERFYVGGAMTVQMLLNKGLFSDNSIYDFFLNYNPTFINYNFEMGYSYRFVTFFYSHDCSHPQDVYSYNHRVTALWGEGGVDRFGIRFRGSIGKTGSR
ncbi:hypothetical protein [Sediminispirochaeta smaragdinae]|jgi:hypothetical protein|uniref:Uncharacterized protein n=1 Tax=Sediminispirochaeta smaragdinae (strain DSM 11293 / JCM 15392 / SEBR 4228) TaxID=573413 RepID=E1R3Q7_SEDSS|nr:hypothetical protein [Sediminispirochaeta smaragdinae]ADK82028.1 hypothetical protein Spirs_2925 [Sediminispirochaeta smaragdinae DSM 11293]